MKISKIKSICSKRKSVGLYQKIAKDTVIQYISDGYAMFIVDNLPFLDKRALLTLFDIPERMWQKWNVCERTEFGLNVEDTTLDEQIIEDFGISVVHNGEIYRTLYTSEGIVFINSSYIAPLTDLTNIEFYERQTNAGQIYIVIKEGLLFKAAIMPYKMISENYIKSLKRHYAECVSKFDELNIESDAERDITFADDGSLQGADYE